MHVLAFVSTHTYSSTQFATFQPSPWLLPGRYLTMTVSCRYYTAYWQPMESVFWKPKSSLALNQHAHTQADHRVQFILHIHTHQQSLSNTFSAHCQECQVFMCMCVCDAKRTSGECSLWFQKQRPKVYWGVRGLLILCWVRGYDRNVPGTFLPASPFVDLG